MDYTEVIENVRAYAEKSVKKSRYEHSVRVAEMCARICRFYGLDEQLGYLAGIGHDICKDEPDEKFIEIAGRDGNVIIPYELAKPSLLHGRAASVYLKELFGIKNKDVLEAVAVHTSGKIGMCDLGKVLFIADKIEPGRPQTNDSYYKRLFSLSLDDMFFSVLMENYEYITKKGYEIFPGTHEMINYYKAERNRE